MKRVIAGLLLVTAGCSGGGGGIGNSVSRADFPKATITAVCTYYVKCGISSTEATCEQYFSAIGLDLSVTAYDKAIELGKIKYDDGAAARCLNSYANLSCTGDVSSAVAADCQAIYTGLLAVGQSCGNSECVPSAYCSTDVDSVCPGTCKARVTEGSSATSSVECTVGLFVSGGVCAKLPTLGQACATVSSVGVCASGLVCDATSKTCVKPPPPGDSCDINTPCGVFSHCTSAGKCANPGALGSDCTTATNTFSAFACQLDFYCDGTCKARVAEGQACTSNDCAPGLNCSGASGARTCKKPLALNATCDASNGSSGVCASKLYCEKASNTCKAQLADGATCLDTDVCDSGSCTSGKCKSFITTAACF